MKTQICKFFILFFLLGIGCNVLAQKKLKTYVDYIDKYNILAIDQMIRYKIPASITLAQALVETGAGTSNLANSSNNHFGIKCHTDWTGETVYRYDDEGPKKSCFRKYNTIEESYEDHSLFLKRPHYAVLFLYDIRDYTSWARGLQECGYATNPNYANILINCVETYELWRYDENLSLPGKNKEENQRRRRPSYITYGLLYVEADANDSFDKIAYDMGFKVKNLLKYNDVPKSDFPLKKGDIVYLEKKKKKADAPYSTYVVKVGDSMHRISQHYGIRLKNLYKINKKKSDYIPTVGDVLKLR